MVGHYTPRQSAQRARGRFRLNPDGHHVMRGIGLQCSISSAIASMAMTLFQFRAVPVTFNSFST